MPSGPNDSKPGDSKPGDDKRGEAPSLHGLAACLALLEIEARALGRPLAAGLIAAAGEALRDPAGQPRHVAQSPPHPTAPADPRRG